MSSQSSKCKMPWSKWFKKNRCFSNQRVVNYNRVWQNQWLCLTDKWWYNNSLVSHFSRHQYNKINNKWWSSKRKWKRRIRLKTLFLILYLQTVRGISLNGTEGAGRGAFWPLMSRMSCVWLRTIWMGMRDAKPWGTSHWSMTKIRKTHIISSLRLK